MSFFVLSGGGRGTSPELQKKREYKFPACGTLLFRASCFFLRWRRFILSLIKFFILLFSSNKIFSNIFFRKQHLPINLHTNPTAKKKKKKKKMKKSMNFHPNRRKITPNPLIQAHTTPECINKMKGGGLPPFLLLEPNNPHNRAQVKMPLHTTIIGRF